MANGTNFRRFDLQDEELDCLRYFNSDQLHISSLLKNYTIEDYLLLTGDPAIIGVACSIVSDMTGGKYSLLKWDKQDRIYYPIKINLHEKGEVNE